MKFVFIFCFLLSSRLFAQTNYFLEYNGSTLLEEKPHHIITFSNTFSFLIKKDKTIYSLGIGREDWIFEYFSKNPKQTSLYSYYCNTYKFVPQIDREFMIRKTKLSIRLGVGLKIFIANQLKDSMTYNYRGLDQTKPSTLMKFKPNAFSNIVDGTNFPSLNNYGYITSIPYAIKFNIAIHYNFNKWGIKLYLEPYMMRYKYQNAKNLDDRGASFVFAPDVGLGIYHQLNFKKKEIKNNEPK